ncbi:hypothetical protein AWC38_SpisGene5210 [Stylophora pistillata]|uniref:Uncharacterized protein n=2 Tax=Stylophora pistillata TaxID=50429 RepID=A0A2B4SKV3_STYPI|nr:hypothetical protein AWC38_SpisGene5210 [Stylophora pistillata]
MDDEELERRAQQELLQEAKRAKSRAEEVGPVGWQRCPLPATNKRFLHNVLASTLEPRKKKSRKTESFETKKKIKSWEPVHKERYEKRPSKDNKTPSKEGRKPNRQNSNKKHFNSRENENLHA